MKARGSALLLRAQSLDAGLYRRLTGVRAPLLDGAMSLLTRSADHARLWLGIGALLSLAGGDGGRRAARRGLLSLLLASAVANLLCKPLAPRRRPVRKVPLGRGAAYLRMPVTSSFPTGHAASAFGFAGGAGAAAPALRAPLRLLAALVAYSRVHTGVHYPADSLAGALVGVGAAKLAGRLLRDRP
jgi:undecaprenyl-diphosphatase